MSNYVIYLRVSSRQQGVSGLGLEAQNDICTQYIKSKDGELLATFKDVESGKSRTRKGLMDAINFCKQNKCTLVIAKLDRLARDVEFTFKIINTGIDIYFCDMPLVNTMILGVFASVAQYERELISIRTKQALNAKRERGEVWNTNNLINNKAVKISAENRRKKALSNENNKLFWEFMQDYQKIYGKITANTDFTPIANELNKRGKMTATGLPFDSKRARAMYSKVRFMYQ